MVIRQGEVYWIDLDEPRGSEPGYRRPFIVVQNDLFNRSRSRTVIVCPLTSNMKRAGVPGNVVLEEGEANLPHRSVVNVTQIDTVDREFFDERIGIVSPERLDEVLEGVWSVLEPRDIEDGWR